MLCKAAYLRRIKPLAVSARAKIQKRLIIENTMKSCLLLFFLTSIAFGLIDRFVGLAGGTSILSKLPGGCEVALVAQLQP